MKYQLKATLTVLFFFLTLTSFRTIPLGSCSVQEHNLSTSVEESRLVSLGFTSRPRLGFSCSSSAHNPRGRHLSPAAVMFLPPLFVMLMLTSYYSADESAVANEFKGARLNELPKVHAGCFFVFFFSLRWTSSKELTLGTETSSPSAGGALN